LFSQDDKSIYQFNLENKQHHINSIANVCKKNYFYSKQYAGEIEKSFSDLENEQNRVLMNIIGHKKLFPQEEDYIYLLTFLTFQFSRTLKFKTYTEDFVQKAFDEVVKPLMRKAPELKEKGITDDFIDTLGLEYPALFGRLIATALRSGPLISDLEIILLDNKTNLNFIFSDSPVISYNLAYIDSGLSLQGFQSPGLMIFCPLNEKTLLLLYDPETYRIKKKSKGRIKLRNPNDILEINTLQFVNCYYNVFYSNKKTEKLINHIYKSKEKEIVESKNKLMEIKRYMRVDGKSELLHFANEKIDCEISLSFVRITVSGPPEKFVRNPELVEAFEKYIEDDDRELGLSNSFSRTHKKQMRDA